MPKKVYGAFEVRNGTASKKPIDVSHSVKALKRRNLSVVIPISIKEVKV